LAEYLEQEPARKKAAAEAQRAKLEALERRLGIDKDAGPSSGSDAQVAGKKHRFDDTEYLEQSKELVDNVKSAVTAGLLRKKRKKAKTEPSQTKSETSKEFSQETPGAQSHVTSPQTNTQVIPVVDTAIVGA